MRIGNRDFDTRKTHVVGILNVTPDSFSDGGKYGTLDAALKRAEEMVSEGAGIIDVGGESTRPGHEKISDEEEIERVLPVIEAIKKNIDVPISIDTYKSRVAEESVKAGADMVNDVYGFEYDAAVADVVAKYKTAYCLTYQRDRKYKDIMTEMIADIEETLGKAFKKGIPMDKICVDPGIGFCKTYEQNLEIIGKIDMLHNFGLPIYLGASRKRFIGKTFDLKVDERLPGTLVTTVMAVMKGVSFVRVHDIKENVRAIRLAQEIIEAG